MKPIASKTFTAALIKEGSWGERDLGEHESTMDLFQGEDVDYFCIEWDMPAIETTEHIGIWVEMINGRRTLRDFDGVFSLPIQAVELLESVGIVVGDDFR